MLIVAKVSIQVRPQISAPARSVMLLAFLPSALYRRPYNAKTLCNELPHYSYITTYNMLATSFAFLNLPFVTARCVSAYDQSILRDCTERSAKAYKLGFGAPLFGRETRST